MVKLKSSLCDRHHDLVNRYGVSVSQITNDRTKNDKHEHHKKTSATLKSIGMAISRRIKTY
jgi:hypothetical protein